MKNLLAQSPGVDIQKYFPPAQTFPTFGDLINILVKNFFVLVMILSFIFLIFGGLKFMMSSGDEKEAEQGKNAITAAVIGFVIIFAAYWIVQIIEFITGVSIFSPGV